MIDLSSWMLASLSWELMRPGWLWLAALALPLLLLFHLRSLSDFPRYQRWLNLMVRTPVVLLLILALAGLVLLRDTRRQMVVLAIDRSTSIDASAAEAADAMVAAISATAADRVPVWTLPLPARSESEVQLAAVTAPAQVRQGEPFFVEVVVNSNRAGRGYIDLYRGDIQIGEDDPQPVEIDQGENRFRFRQSVTEERQVTFAARLRGLEDTLLDNNEASSLVYAEGRPRVLMIDPDTDQTDAFRWAMEEQEIDVEGRPPNGIPCDLAELELSPLLLGYVVTRPKPTSEFILASESGDPVLAWWRYGLGMTVAFTSDAKNRWAGEWLAWPDFRTFWAQIIRHATDSLDAR